MRGAAVADVDAHAVGRPRRRAGAAAGARAGDHAAAAEVDDGGAQRAPAGGDERPPAEDGEATAAALAAELDRAAERAADRVERDETPARGDPGAVRSVEGDRAGALDPRAAPHAQRGEVGHEGAIAQRDDGAGAVRRDGERPGGAREPDRGQRPEGGRVEDPQPPPVGRVDARTVGRDGDAGDDTAERRGPGGPARREVDRGHAAAGGDVRPRAVGCGRHRPRPAGEGEAGGDPVGRHVEQRGLGPVDGHDDDARVGGGGGEQGEREDERDEAAHVRPSTRLRGAGCG